MRLKKTVQAMSAGCAMRKGDEPEAASPAPAPRVAASEVVASEEKTTTSAAGGAGAEVATAETSPWAMASDESMPGARDEASEVALNRLANVEVGSEFMAENGRRRKPT